MSVLIYPSLQAPVPTGVNTAATEATWHKQWADPNLWVKVAATAAIALIASGQTFDPFPRGTPEFIGPDKWMQPFSERLHPKRGLQAASQQALAYSESAQFPETTTIDRYLYPFSEPVRVPKRLLPGLQPFVSAQPNPIISIAWFRELSLPQKLTPPILPVPEQHVFEFEPAPIISIAWFQALSEPKRFKPELPKALNMAFTTGAHAFGTPYARGYVIC
jgi:hypothetical protein